MRRTVEVLGVCAVVGMLLGNLFADPPSTLISEDVKSEDVQSEEQPVARLAEELRQQMHDPVTIALDKVPIRDAMDELLGQRKIDFWFDEYVLSEEQISLDGPEVSCDLHNVSIRAALKQLLSQLKMSWVCEDAGIRITSATQASRAHFARVYEVTDLLAGPDVEVNAPKLPAQAAQFGGSGLGGPVETPDNAAKPPVSNSPEKNLIKMLTEVTGGLPDSPWLEADGEGGSVHLVQTPHTKLLVVKQNERTQAEIEDLLNDLLSHIHSDDEVTGEARPKNAARQDSRKAVRVVVKRGAR